MLCKEDDSVGDHVEPLVTAVKEGNLENVKMLIQTHGLTNLKNSRGDFTLLCNAIRKNRIEIAKILLQEGAKVNPETNNVNTPLHFATDHVCADVELVRLLLEKNAMVDARNSQDETPLHLAAKRGFAEIVQVLLDNDASVTARTIESSTPLFFALEGRHEDVFQMLLEHACANVKDQKDNVLSVSPVKRNLNDILLCNSRVQKKVSMLVVKIVMNSNSRSKIVDELTARGFALSREFISESLFLAAVTKNYIKFVKNILLDGAFSIGTEYKTLILHTAVEKGHTEIVELFLKLYPNDTSYKFLLLHTAVNNGYKEIVELFLKFYPNDTSHNSSLLHLAVERGFKEIVESFLKSFSHDTSYNSLLLPTAVEKGHTEIVELLIKSFPNYTSYHFSLLHTAVERGHTGIVDLLLKLGFDVNAKDQKGHTPICYSLSCEESKCVEILRLLLASGANIAKVRELLHVAVSKAFIEVCKVLIENGIDINAQNTSGITPLHLAMENEKSDFVFWRTGEEKIKEAARDKIGKLLLNSGADFNIKASDGCTAFHYAVKTGRTEPVRTFLDHGVYVDICSEDNSTPLHLAAERGFRDIADILCENDANVDARQKDGSTPLHLAVYKESTNAMPMTFSVFKGGVSTLLLSCSCDINVETNSGDTALNIAISRAKSEYVEYKRKRYNGHGFDGQLWADDFEFQDNQFSSDEDDYIDNAFDFDKYYVVHILKQHLIKLKVAGMYVSRKNLLLQEKISEYSAFEKSCVEEVIRLKNEVLQPPITLFKILTEGNNRAFFKNEPLMQTSESFNSITFPVYGSLIKKNFEKNKLRLKLSRPGQDSLETLIKISSILNRKTFLTLPDELLEQIVLYLTNGELKSLISCGAALKRQLHP